MRVTCKHCGGSHPAFYCKKSTAARKDVHDMRTSVSSGGVRQSTGSFSGASRAAEPAGTQALPVDTNSSASLRKDCAGIGLASPAKVLDAEAANIKDAHTPKRGRGRPKTITDMKVYKAMKQREYRARKKNG